MTASGQTFEIYAGDSLTLDFAITDVNGMPLDLTDASMQWQMALTSLSRHLVAKTLGSGITITDPAGGRVSVQLEPSDTANIAPRLYYHELEMTDAAGNASTLAYGVATVKPALIRR